jgi:uncharacterized protein
LMPEKAEFVHNCILINVAQKYRPNLTALELYDATRGIWSMNPQIHAVEYALCVHDGIVREVYKVAGWFPAGSTFTSRPDLQGSLTGKAKERWEFVGNLAEEEVREKYLLRNVHDYMHGQTNPICYVSPKPSLGGARPQKNLRRSLQRRAGKYR